MSIGPLRKATPIRQLNPINAPQSLKTALGSGRFPTATPKKKKFILRTRDMIPFKVRTWMSNKLKELAEWISPGKDKVVFDKETKELWSRIISQEIGDWGGVINGDKKTPNNLYEEYKRNSPDNKGLEEIVLEDLLAQEAVEEKKEVEREEFQALKDSIISTAKDNKPAKSSISAIQEVIDLINKSHPREAYKHIDTYSKMYSPLDDAWIRTVNFKDDYLGLKVIYAFNYDPRSKGTNVLGGYFKYSNRKPVSFGKFNFADIVLLNSQLHWLGQTKPKKIEDVVEHVQTPAKKIDLNELLRTGVIKPVQERATVRTKECYGLEKSINGKDFINGMLNVSFNLGEDFHTINGATIRFVSDKDIYYRDKKENILVVKEGGNIPFFHQIQVWSEDQFQNKEAKVVLDLRPKGIYGANFDPKKLNSGGKTRSLKINVTPTYRG